MMLNLKQFVREYGSVHRADGTPPVFLMAIPRGGSTWMMELLGSLPGMRMISEPFNLRVTQIAEAIGGSQWDEIGTPEMQQKGAAYLNKLEQGKIRFLNPNPFTQFRFFTHRNLYKIIHLPIDIAQQIEGICGGKQIVCLRHPAPVSLSRKVFPLLEVLPESPIFTTLSKPQQECVVQTLQSGSHLKKGILAWCLHFSPYLLARTVQANPGDLLLTYEDMLQDAEGMLLRIAAYLNEPFPEQVQKKINRPSRVLKKSDSKTQEVLRSHAQGESRTRYLLSRWEEQLSDADKADSQEILDLFCVNIYSMYSPLPKLKEQRT